MGTEIISWDKRGLSVKITSSTCDEVKKAPSYTSTAS
jgi:hypothetical protein